MKVTELQRHHAAQAYQSLGSLLVSLPNGPKRGRTAKALRQLRSAAKSLQAAISAMKVVEK